MARFIFRAAAALDLRQRQEDDAAAALARTEARLREIGAARDEAARRVEAARDQSTDAVTGGCDVAMLEWHRNWILKLTGDVMRLQQDYARQTGVVGAAERVWREARRKRLALERMRMRVRRRFETEQARLEALAMDEVARLRFLADDEQRSEVS